jgi:hypothetical protein
MRLTRLPAPTYPLNRWYLHKNTNLSAFPRFISPINIRRSLRAIYRIPKLTYHSLDFDEVEDIELYIPRGLYPVAIADILDHGRYRLVHKLGNGFKSTTWLTRDLQWTDGRNSKDLLVAIKTLQSSDPSVPSVPFQPPEELKVAQALQALALDRGREDIRSQLLSIHSSFTEVGPNGTHACLVSPVAGLTIQTFVQCPRWPMGPSNWAWLAKYVDKSRRHCTSCTPLAMFMEVSSRICLYAMKVCQVYVIRPSAKKIFSSNCLTGPWRLRTMISIKHWEPHMWNV